MASVPPHPPKPRPRVNRPHPPSKPQRDADRSDHPTHSDDPVKPAANSERHPQEPPSRTPPQDPPPRPPPPRPLPPASSPPPPASSPPEHSTSTPHPPQPAPRRASSAAEEHVSESLPPDYEAFSPTESAYEEPVSLKTKLLSASEPHPPDKHQEGEDGAGQLSSSPYSEEEPPYVDIERNQPDYVNLDSEEGSGSEEEGGHPIRGSGYYPSVKLHSHPLLKKSLSHSETDSPSSMVELMKAAGKKPKNRAPPPPPGAARDDKSARSLATGAMKHKRSQSDVASSSASRGLSAAGHKSPIPEDASSRKSPVADRRSPLADRRSPLADRRSPLAERRFPPQTAGQSSSSQEHRSRGSKDSSPVLPRRNVAGKAAKSAATPQPTGTEGSKAEGSRVTKSKHPFRPPPPPSGPAPPGPRDRKAAVQSRHISAWGEEKGVARPTPPPPPTQQERSRDSPAVRDQNASPSSGSNTPSIKPKRHAPPPPMGGAVRKTPTSSPEVARRRKVSPGPPKYSEVMKEKRLNLEAGRGNRPPSKPARMSRSQSLSDLTESQELAGSPVSSPTDNLEEILRCMDLLTIELRKEGDEQVGLLMVDGKLRSGTGVMAAGVFVQQVIPGSPADLDGRIQAGDMLVEVYGCEVRAGNYEQVVQLLDQPSASVRLKVARPDITSSVFSLQGGKEEPIYMNQITAPDHLELQEKLERTRLRASEFEREKELALKELEKLREKTAKEKEELQKEAEELKQSTAKEKEELQKEVEELKRSFEEYKKDSEEKSSEVALSLTAVTVSKTKAESELECQKDKLKNLQLQLEEERAKAEEELTAVKLQLAESEELKDQDLVKTKDLERKVEALKTELSQQKEEGAMMLATKECKESIIAKLEERLAEANTRLTTAEEEVKDEKALNRKLVKELSEKADSVASHKDTDTQLVDQVQTELAETKAELQTLKMRLEHAEREIKDEKAINQTLHQKIDSQVATIEDLEEVVAKLEKQVQGSVAIARVSTPERDELQGKPHSHSPRQQSPEVTRPQSPKAVHKELTPPQADDDIRPVSALSEEDIHIHENGEVTSEGDSDKDDDAFDNKVPSPVAPCPYIDFVPLQPGEVRSKEKVKPPETTPPEEGGSEQKEVESKDVAEQADVEEVKDGRETSEMTEEADNEPPTHDDTKEGSVKSEPPSDTGVEVAEETVVPVTTKSDNVPVITESENDEVKKKPEVSEVTAEKEESDPKAEFDAIKPRNMLNTSVGVYKSRVGSTRKRKQPSRSHLQKMGSSGNLLDNIPEELRSKLDKPLEDGQEPAPSEKPKPDQPKPEHTAEEPHAPVPQPKPRPRAAPRKKPQPTPAPDEHKDTKKAPLAAPRIRAQTVDTSVSPKPSPKHAVKEPVDMITEDPTEEPTTKPSPRHKPAAKLPHVGPKPAAKPSKHPPKDPSDSPAREPTTEEQGSPSRSRTNSSEKELVSPESASKDPSKLTVKEKAMLAQKVLLGTTPDKHKPGPPIPRKPKPTPATPVMSSESSPAHETVVSPESQLRLADGEAEDSPGQQRRKLPPGAFNMMMMGGVSVFGPGAADRNRSATVSTSEPRVREQNSFERRSQSRELSPDRVIQEEDGEEEPDAPSELIEEHKSPAVTPKIPSVDNLEDNSHTKKVSVTPPSPAKYKHRDSDVAPPVTTEDMGGSEEVEAVATDSVDLDVVLTWTPDVTAGWLSQVGLAAYQHAFVEKGIQGHMLFDLDGSKLKGLGMSSHDDRALFKKEVKTLKPYADKQKKLLEKQRKEEKKSAKKKKR